MKSRFLAVIRNHRAFCVHRKMWDIAKAQWDEAHKRGDMAAMQAAYRREEDAYAAEQAVHRDLLLLLPPWKWIKRWNAHAK